MAESWPLPHHPIHPRLLDHAVHTERREKLPFRRVRLQQELHTGANRFNTPNKNIVMHITYTQSFKETRTVWTCTRSTVVCGLKAGFEYSKSSQLNLKDINMVR